MKGTDEFHIAEYVVIAVTVAIVSGAYLLVLPRYFDDRETSCIVGVGVVAGAMARGTWARWFGTHRWPRWWLTVTICASVVVAIVGLSLYVILDRRDAVSPDVGQVSHPATDK